MTTREAILFPQHRLEARAEQDPASATLMERHNQIQQLLRSSRVCDLNALPTSTQDSGVP
jgi:hypothetical protein